MSAAYSSRASAIIATMRAVLPATSPTGKSNWAMAMRRVSVMSDSMRQHVDGGKYGLPLVREIGGLRPEHARRHAHDLRRVHDQLAAVHRQARHQAVHDQAGPLHRDQRHDHARTDGPDQVALHVQQVRDRLPGYRIGVDVRDKLAHPPSPKARTWSTSMPSRSMRRLYASIACRFSSSHCSRRRARTSASSAFSSVAERLMSSARASSSRPWLMLTLVARLAWPA